MYDHSCIFVNYAQGLFAGSRKPEKKQPVRSNVPPGVISALAADHSGEQSSIR